jgi:hypothetical protein
MEEDYFRENNPTSSPKSIKKFQKMLIIMKSKMKKWEGARR